MFLVKCRETIFFAVEWALEEKCMERLKCFKA